MMNVVDRIHGKPRGAPIETDTPDVLVYALARLRKCKDAIDVLRLTDELPDVILPYLTWAASRRQDIPARVVRILMKCCGELFLERALGLYRLRVLKSRYPGWQDPSGLRG
ncbi:hypothetical protein ACVJGD_004606 [Bradyrhizobium sp. USDA 10063]